MNILALMLLAILSCGIVAVSLRLHAGLSRRARLAFGEPAGVGNAQRRDTAA